MPLGTGDIALAGSRALPVFSFRFSSSGPIICYRCLLCKRSQCVNRRLNFVNLCAVDYFLCARHDNALRVQTLRLCNLSVIFITSRLQTPYSVLHIHTTRKYACSRPYLLCSLNKFYYLSACFSA